MPTHLDQVDVVGKLHDALHVVVVNVYLSCVEVLDARPDALGREVEGYDRGVFLPEQPGEVISLEKEDTNSAESKTVKLHPEGTSL